jgi:hypothetical protein
VCPLGKLFGKSREFFRRTKQTGIDEIKDRPKITQSVFDGCAGQYDPLSCLKLFHRVRLFRARILDRLSFIEDNQIPRYPG